MSRATPKPGCPACPRLAGDSCAQEFDYREHFEIDSGRAAEIAEFLPQSGYPGCFADGVTDELARPEQERSMIELHVTELLRSGIGRL